MPHLNPSGTDWVNAAFVVHPHEPKVLLVRHKALGTLLPVGGHIELDTADADPDAALVREIGEETGLVLWPNDGNTDKDTPFTAYVYQTPEQDALRSLTRKLDPVENNGARQHWVPWSLETHLFPPVPGHKHLCLVYLVYALTPEIRLEADAHHSIGWFTIADLWAPEPRVRSKIREYGWLAVNHRHGYRRDWDLSRPRDVLP